MSGLSIDQFWEKYADEPFELIGGQVVEARPKGEQANQVIEAIAAELEEFVDWQDNEDILAGSVACKLSNDNMIAADITLIKEQHLSQITDPESYVPFAPDFVVEVAGENQTEADLQARAKLYLQAGTQLIWLVYPTREVVEVFYPNGTSRQVTGDQNIGGSEVMPRLELTPNEIFNP